MGYTLFFCFFFPLIFLPKTHTGTGENGDNGVGQGGSSTAGSTVGNHGHGRGYKSGASVLSLPPHLPSRPKLFVITPASVLKQVKD